MATKKEPSAKKPKQAKWAKNSADYKKKQEAKAKKSGKVNLNTEDLYIRKRRIRDVGQKPPKGYMRTGGRYFAQIKNMRPIRSMTTADQDALWRANIDRWLGVNRDGGYLGSAANQGMYNGEASEANFRKTQGARRLIDADGGTYPPGYKEKMRAGTGTRKKGLAKSRYIIAIGQDGHMR